MHRLLLVDDDILVRVGLRMMIHWQDHGWEIVGEAANGLQALEMIDSMSPDLLIMDMKMPQLDGADLLKRLCERGRKPKILVLSCYDDYNYMREALASGANEYILKPELTAEALAEALRRIRGQIVAEEQRDKEFYELKKQAALHSYYANDTFYRELLRGHFASRPELEAAAAQYAVEMPDHEYAVLLFSAAAQGGVLDEYTQQKREAVENSFFNIVQGFLQMLPYSCVIKDADSGDFIAVVRRPAGGQLLSDAESVANRAVQAVSAYMRLKLTVGISAATQDPLLLYHELTRAREALRGRLLYEDRNVFSCMRPAEGEAHLREFIMKLQARMQELFGALAGGGTERFAGLLHDLLEEVRGKGSMRLLRMVCGELAGWYNRQLDLVTMEGNFAQEAEYLNVEELMSAKGIKELAEAFIDRAVRLGGTGSMRFAGELSPPIRKAVAFIQARYDGAISLADLSEYVGMSRSHLSLVFREQTGLNFVDYLTHYRIQQAKRLLRSDSSKIYEIASRVGFHNEKYFSQVFRSRVGVTPSEYKRSPG